MERGGTDGEAETVRDEKGNRVLLLNGYKDDMTLGEQLLLGVNIQHEAYRDGIDNGVEGQRLETDRAVVGHIAMAERIMGSYGAGILGEEMFMEVMLYRYAQETGNGQLTRAMLDRYDSSADLWKLTNDGKLKNDGQGYLKDENGMYINADGSRSWTITDKTIGAGGLETGLLNILFGGTHNEAYDNFTDDQVWIAQLLMNRSKIEVVSGSSTNMRAIQWSKENGEQELDMAMAMSLAGGTIAGQVLARYYDSTVDARLASVFGVTLGGVEIRDIPYAAKNRYDDLLLSKFEFYESIGNILSDSKNYYVSGDFIGNIEENKENGWYAAFGYKHYGIDFSREGGPLGDAIYAGISGQATSVNWNTERNGNSLQMEYGYNFEGGFIGTGLVGEYLHMENKPAFSAGQYISSSMQIGTVGETGVGIGPHLHYDIFTQGSNYSRTTLAMLLGPNTAANSFSAGNKTVYDPKLYYSNWLKKSLTVR
jgi:murein DD-endopeptidase MepM/ murein hydrolase activator NlpD